MKKSKQGRTRCQMLITALAFVCALTVLVTRSDVARAQQTDGVINESVASSGKSAWVPVSNTVTITTQPSSITVAVGNKATFTVAATSTSTSMKYQWQYKAPGSTKWNSSTQAGATTSTLSFTTNVNHNGYQYRCAITETSGTTKYSNAATLTIIPKITTQPVKQTVSVGDTAVFTIAANGKATLTYQWQCKSPTASSWSNSTQTGATTNQLSIKTTVNHNGYQYRCVVTDGNGKKAYSNAATLTIGPKITTQPKSTSAKVGTAATFTVAATGKTTLTYQWQGKAPNSTKWTNSTQTGATTPTLKVNTTANHHGWQYRCVITDGNGKTVTSNAATLSVFRIVTQPISRSVPKGVMAQFYVTATGSNLKYQWQSKAPGATEWKDSQFSGAKTSTISMKMYDSYSGFQFRCIVTDGSGMSITTNEVKLVVGQLAIDAYNFPDNVFREYIAENIDKDGNRKLSAEEILGTDNISFWTLGEWGYDDYNSNYYRVGVGITDLKGVEFFSNLVRLDCEGSAITKLILNKCTALEELRCTYNDALTSLNLSGLTSLQTLSISRNSKLTSLNLNGLSSLESLYCYGCNLTSLKLSNLPSLREIYCESNQLKSLDLSGCPAISSVHCQKNQLTSINLSGCSELSTLECGDNCFQTLNLNDCTALYGLYCENNQLMSLNLSKNENLAELYCADNKLTALNVSGFANLKYLRCHSNQLKTLMLTGCSSLVGLNCANNQLETLALEQTPLLESLNCGYNPLKSLNVSCCTELVWLACEQNQLSGLNLSKCTKLEQLYCGLNSLKTLSLGNNKELTAISCEVNKLTALDLSQNTKLLCVAAENNPIDTINLTNNTALQYFTIDKLLIAEQPKSYQAPVGGKAVFAVDAYGKELSYQWQAKGPAATQWTNSTQAGATTNVLTVSVTTAHAGYQYRCVITDKNGKKLTTDAATLTVGNIAIDETNFPDAAFRTHVSDNYDKDKNGYLNAEELLAVKTIPGENVAMNGTCCYSLKGIEFFTELEVLNCGKTHDYNQWAYLCKELDELDLSRNVKLKELYCMDCGIKNLNLRNNIKLQKLDCSTNGLSYIDLSKNVALEKISGWRDSYLRFLDLSNNTALKEINYCWLSITALDLSNNTEIERINLGAKLVELDLTNNKKLSFLCIDCDTKVTGLPEGVVRSAYDYR